MARQVSGPGGSTAGIVLCTLLAAGCAGETSAPEGGGAAAATTTGREERATMDDLEGVAWVLERLAADEPVPRRPEITLVVDEGRFVGTSGCNRYSAFARAGESPQELSLGRALGTRMACPPEVMALEQRYLGLLQSVKRFRVDDGVLSLEWSGEAAAGTLTFSSRPLPE